MIVFSTLVYEWAKGEGTHTYMG